MAFSIHNTHEVQRVNALNVECALIYEILGYQCRKQFGQARIRHSLVVSRSKYRPYIHVTHSRQNAEIANIEVGSDITYVRDAETGSTAYSSPSHAHLFA
jgi:hypothetical protein